MDAIYTVQSGMVATAEGSLIHLRTIEGTDKHGNCPMKAKTRRGEVKPASAILRAEELDLLWCSSYPEH